MNVNNIQYWINKAMKLMRKEGKTKPAIVEEFEKLDIFINSGFTKQQLSEGISFELAKERMDIINEIKKIATKSKSAG